MRFRSLLLATSLAVALPAFAAPVAYEIDTRHTQVQFTYAHLGFSHITGRFDAISGTFSFDAADPSASKIDVTIPISSISTGVPDLDEHMKSPDMFDAAQFPTATFASKSVTAAGEGRWDVAGDLTIHGVTKPVVLAVTVNGIGEHPMMKVPTAGFDATTTIKRSDFGIGYAVPKVGDEVTIHISMEARVPKAD